MSSTGDQPSGTGAAGSGPEGCGRSCVHGEWDVALVVSPELTVPMRTRFIYRVQEPYAVHLDFGVGTSRSVRWSFARELLTAGMLRPAGNGDVRVWPERARDAVRLALTPPDGHVLLEVPRGSLAGWLESTYQLVPPGDEERFFDIDAPLARLRRDAVPYDDQGNH